MFFYLPIFDLLQYTMLPCLFKMFTGTDCPGCGFQRSVMLLLQGKISASVSMFWATIPIILLLLICMLHLKFKFRNGSQVLVLLYCLVSVLIICNYIYKLSHHM